MLKTPRTCPKTEVTSGQGDSLLIQSKGEDEERDQNQNLIPIKNLDWDLVALT